MLKTVEISRHILAQGELVRVLEEGLAEIMVGTRFCVGKLIPDYRRKSDDNLERA